MSPYFISSFSCVDGTILIRIKDANSNIITTFSVTADVLMNSNIVPTGKESHPVVEKEIE